MGLRIPEGRTGKRSIKSGKKRRAEIKARRESLRPTNAWVNQASFREKWPKGAVAANHEQLAHNNTYGLLPYFYVDKPFACRDCGKEEVWRATQQKWWYEVAKGQIDTKAVRCKTCRRKERERKEKARAASLPGLLAKRMRPQS